MPDDKRLIEDYLPIEAISKEASREKSVRKGHISTLHLWWARRPLVACRAAVYGALVPADRWVREVNLKNPPTDPAKAEAMINGAKKGLNRKAAGEFVTRLCRYPKDSDPTQKADIEKAIVEARKHILEAHRERLLAEWESKRDDGHQSEPRAQATGPPLDKDGQQISKDTPLDKVPPPKVLDMFAGGGAIPLEALRLGCEAYALDLNPVAHIIQLCTLVYPQKYGKTDPNAHGMTGSKNAKGETTWGGLANEVRYWGEWVLEKVRAEIGDLYPLIPDPEADPDEIGADRQRRMDFARDAQGRLTVPCGYLTPVAYLWTRTVKCKNPTCEATVPLVKQTWLCKKKGRYVALKQRAHKGMKRVQFDLAEASTASDLGFDPAAGSKGGNAICPFCGTVADAEYTQKQGILRCVGAQLLAVVCRRSRGAGTAFLATDELPEASVPDDCVIEERIAVALKRRPNVLPTEKISPIRPSPNARGLTAPTRHGLTEFRDLFHLRQLLSLLTQCNVVENAVRAMADQSYEREQIGAIGAYLGIIVDRMADRGSSLCRWDSGYTKTQSTFGRPALPFVWDYSETNPFGNASGDMSQAIEWVTRVIVEVGGIGHNAEVSRGSALSLPNADSSVDAVITDPPYYDNVPYGDISDFFYVWLKRSIGTLYPEHFSGSLSPKKAEATALSSRHDGNMAAASLKYEEMMQRSFVEAHRVLKPGGQLVVVYAHKTTLGWATLVEALRSSGFVVTEAWPLDTEFGGRLMAQDAAALASSIFLVGRKREQNAGIGNHEGKVRPELQRIVRERVETLWEMGIAGADLVIAAVGAGLRAFTKYERVEYANGEEVPAEQFLNEVEGVVLDTILRRLSKASGSNGKGISLAGVDEPTRFYILWRYAYRAATLDAGEAIIFANGTHVELDGQNGLSTGSRAIVEKAKSKYRLRDFTERGDDDKLGLPDDGHPAPLIDTLHRTLWLMENRPAKLRDYLEEARPDRERLRLVAQALAGTALKGGKEEGATLVGTTQPEQAALGKLTANWRSLIDQTLSAVETGLFGEQQGS